MMWARRAAGCRAAARRYCSTGDTSPGEGDRTTQLKSGAIMRKGGNEVGEREHAPLTNEEKGMWFLKDDRRGDVVDVNAPYMMDGGGDKGFPYASKHAREFEDTRDFSELNKTTQADLAIRGLHQELTPELRQKQKAMRAKRKSRRALYEVMGEEEGVIEVQREEGIVIVHLMGVRGALTGGMMDQLSALMIQIHNMREVHGVVFNIRGNLEGMPTVDNTPMVGAPIAHEASQRAQRLSIDMMHTQMITVVTFNGALSGVPLELMLHADFIYTGPQATMDFDAVRSSHVGLCGGAHRVAERSTYNKALMLMCNSEGLTLEECLGLGLVDRVVKDPLASAVGFLKSFDGGQWRNIRQLKDIAVTAVMHEGREGLLKEQFHFRNTWQSEKHKDSAEHFVRSM